MLILAFLNGAAPYTVYQFRVQASTSAGYGRFSEPRVFNTLRSSKLGQLKHLVVAMATHACDVTTHVAN